LPLPALVRAFYEEHRYDKYQYQQALRKLRRAQPQEEQGKYCLAAIDYQQLQPAATGFSNSLELRLVSLLRDNLDLAQVHTLRLSLVQQSPKLLLRDALASGKQPEVVEAVANHQRRLVLIIQTHHVVATVERTEERHLERRDAGIAQESRLAVGLTPTFFDAS
jgi:hypothetical protein